MKQIEKWYITNIRENNNVQRWSDIFLNAGENKPFVILTGESGQESMPLDNHLRYLWRFNHEEAINHFNHDAYDVCMPEQQPDQCCHW